MFKFQETSSIQVSLSFQDAKLVNVVRMLLSEDNLNLIMGEDVSGRVTVNLDDVSLETALDAILRIIMMVHPGQYYYCSANNYKESNEW